MPPSPLLPSPRLHQFPSSEPRHQAEMWEYMVVGDFNAAREHMEIPMRARYQKCWYTKHADDALENFLEGLTSPHGTKEGYRKPNLMRQSWYSMKRVTKAPASHRGRSMAA
mmetsp:Transcript_33517/g.75248  ORF Transcript_33517/g.75248 Transcript_33517/m.75248 type:complete len:111 (-) Transcript_33517:1053-1385(-)